LKGIAKVISPDAAPLLSTPSLYAVPPLLTLISNGCDPPEIFLNLYALPRARYKTGFGVPDTVNPIPLKVYSVVPFAFTSQLPEYV